MSVGVTMSSGERPKLTEPEMFELLGKHLGASQNSDNGPSVIVVPSVRSAAAFDARRTLDAISMSMWPSRGMLIEGYEIKCDRGDVLRELKNPQKAEEFMPMLDRFWLVVADKGMVHDGELPPSWGLIARTGRGMKKIVQAAALHEPTGEIRQGHHVGLPPGFSRSFLVPLLRQAHAIPPDVRAELKAEAERQAGHRIDDAEDRLARLQAQVDAFEKAAGIEITGFREYGGPDAAAARGAAFKTALAGEKGVERLREDLKYIGQYAERIATSAREIAGEPDQEARDAA